MRSGFTHVRICLDCKQQIDQGNACGCSSAHNPFTKGASITICADEACLVPTSIEEIGRVGNGQYRIKGTGTWYNFDGHCTTGQNNYARVSQPLDASEIAKVKKRIAILGQIKSAKYSRELFAEQVKKFESEAKIAESEAVRFEQAAAKIDPKTEGEIARVRYEAEARRMIGVRLADAEKQRKQCALHLENAEKSRKTVSMYNAQIDSLNAQLKA